MDQPQHGRQIYFTYKRLVGCRLIHIISMLGQQTNYSRPDGFVNLKNHGFDFCLCQGNANQPANTVSQGGGGDSNDDLSCAGEPNASTRHQGDRRADDE